MQTEQARNLKKTESFSWNRGYYAVRRAKCCMWAQRNWNTRPKFSRNWDECMEVRLTAHGVWFGNQHTANSAKRQHQWNTGVPCVHACWTLAHACNMRPNPPVARGVWSSTQTEEGWQMTDDASTIMPRGLRLAHSATNAQTKEWRSVVMEGCQYQYWWRTTSTLQA